MNVVTFVIFDCFHWGGDPGEWDVSRVGLIQVWARISEDPIILSLHSRSKFETIINPRRMSYFGLFRHWFRPAFAWTPVLPSLPFGSSDPPPPSYEDSAHLLSPMAFPPPQNRWPRRERSPHESSPFVHPNIAIISLQLFCLDVN